MDEPKSEWDCNWRLHGALIHRAESRFVCARAHVRVSFWGTNTNVVTETDSETVRGKRVMNQCLCYSFSQSVKQSCKVEVHLSLSLIWLSRSDAQTPCHSLQTHSVIPFVCWCLCLCMCVCIQSIMWKLCIKLLVSSCKHANKLYFSLSPIKYVDIQLITLALSHR